MNLDLRLVETGLDRRIEALGEIDVTTCDQLHQELTSAVRDGTGSVVLDLRGATYMDSSGLRALVRAREELAGTGRSLTVLATGSIARVFELTSLVEAFNVHDVAEPRLDPDQAGEET